MTTFPPILPGLLLIISVPRVASVIQVEVISLLPFSLDVAPGLIWTGAAFDQAVKTVNRNYAPWLNFTLTLLYKTSHKSCADIIADSGEMMANYYYRRTTPRTVYGFVASTCTDLVGMQSFAKEWDWLLFNNGLTKDEFLDKNVNPTALAVGGTYPGFSLFIMKFLAMYRWSHVTVLLQGRTVSTFYPELATDLRKRSRKQNGYLLSLEVFTFTMENRSMTDALEYARNRSRVIIILAPATVALSILALSQLLGMDERGEYAFINVQPLQQAGYGKATDFSHPATEQLKAFRSSIYIACRSSGVELQQLNDELRAETKVLYNRTYPPDEQPLDSYAVRAAYDIIDLVAITLNESADYESGSFVRSGRNLADRMCNRTFSTGTGQYYIDSAGARYLDMDVFGFITTNNTMERLGWWSWARGSMNWRNINMTWPTADGQAPPDVPLCGFSGSEGPCSAQPPNDRTLKVVLPAVGAIGAVIVVVLLFAVLHATPHLELLDPPDLFIPDATAGMLTESFRWSAVDFDEQRFP